MKFDAILFDLDGTLVDSVHQNSVILNRLREEQGKDPLPESEYRTLVSHGAGALLQYACSIEEQEIGYWIEKFRNYYRKTKTPVTSLYPQVKESLQELKDLGVSLGVCSNKPNYLCAQVLRETGIAHYFDAVVAGGDAEYLKPSRNPIDLIMKKLEVGPEGTVLVGDSTVDQKAAAAANIQFIFFSGGYDDGVCLRGNDSEIKGINELLDFIGGQY